MARLASRVAFVVLVLTAQAAAYPSLWAGEGKVKCPDHPMKADGDHGAPQPDAKTTFAVTDSASGKPVTAVCPGATYTVTASFPEPRLALLTTDVGSFAKADSKCPGRVVMDRTKAYKPSPSQAASLAVPCGATKPVQLRVTSAAGSAGAFMQAASTLPLAAKCPKC